MRVFVGLITAAIILCRQNNGLERPAEAAAKVQVSSVKDITGQSHAGRLTKSGGVFYGPSGKETWYNLPMQGVVDMMRAHGFSEEKYPYHVREDGVKMLGDYVMVGASFDIRPRGTLIETSLGMGIVCDTGSFAQSDQTQLDIAVSW